MSQKPEDTNQHFIGGKELPSLDDRQVGDTWDDFNGSRLVYMVQIVRGKKVWVQASELW